MAAAFATNSLGAALATGYRLDSVRRSLILAAEVLAEKQERYMKEVVASHRGPFMIVKRSWDETRVNVRESGGPVTPTKMSNQRCHLRWSRNQASRLMFPAIELQGTDALSQLEGLERVCPPISIGALSTVAQRLPWMVSLMLGDSLSANKLMFYILASLMPDAFHWYPAANVIRT